MFLYRVRPSCGATGLVFKYLFIHLCISIYLYICSSLSYQFVKLTLSLFIYLSIQGATELRGNLVWAPPRPQIVLTVQIKPQNRKVFFFNRRVALLLKTAERLLCCQKTDFFLLLCTERLLCC